MDMESSAKIVDVITKEVEENRLEPSALMVMLVILMCETATLFSPSSTNTEIADRVRELVLLRLNASRR